jgi:hypothetical protein
MVIFNSYVKLPEGTSASLLKPFCQKWGYVNLISSKDVVGIAWPAKALLVTFFHVVFMWMNENSQYRDGSKPKKYHIFGK